MQSQPYDTNKYPLQDETNIILGTAVDIHKTLGAGFLEIVYKDAFEYEFRNRDILFEREKQYKILYKNIILPHHFYADFIVFNKVILEIKANEGGIAEEMYAQTLNYLKVSGCKVGLILNFGKSKIEIKRVVF
jgi:GxxExxY protein